MYVGFLANPAFLQWIKLHKGFCVPGPYADSSTKTKATGKNNIAQAQDRSPGSPPMLIHSL